MSNATLEDRVSERIAKILPKVVRSAMLELRNEESGIKIRNGVKQPTVEDPSYLAWKAFGIWKDGGVEPTPLLARRLAYELKMPANVVVTDLYLWRKFNGFAK
jgi:hypothetical protein